MINKYTLEFDKFFNITRSFSRMVGADLVKENYRMNWITYFILLLINGSIIFTFYSIYVAVGVKNNWTEFLQLLCMFGPGVQGYVKLVSSLAKIKLLNFIYIEIKDIYSEYEQKFKYHKLLKDSIQLVKKVTGLLLACVFFIISAIIGTPVIYKLIYNERIFIMPFFFPYIDYESDFGYYITSMFHIICVIFGVCGNFVSDCWCFIFVVHIPLMKNILQMKLKELDELLEGENKDQRKVQQKLLEIIKWHQKYIIFCDANQDLYFYVIFVQVITEFVSIVCTIVCIFLSIWPAAPAYLIYSCVMLYTHCALGNIVEVSNDDIIEMIYDCNWYKMNVLQQKMILMMLKKSQTVSGMSIGGMAPLSLNTALQISKTIYTFAVILRESLNK